MTPQNILPEVRRLLNDEVPANYRWTDAELLGWINACLNAMVDLRPDLFSAQLPHTCAAGPLQEVSFDRVRAVTEVVRITGGKAVHFAVKEALDRFDPTWYTKASGPAVNWLPHPASPRKFYLYPPAPLGQQVDVLFTQAHAPVSAMTDVIDLPENYAPAIQSFVVFRAESKEDEAVNTNRAQAFMSDFAGLIGANKGA